MSHARTRSPGARSSSRAGAAGVAVAGGTLWATAPAAARARRYGKAQARSGTSSSRARRTGRSTTTSATRRRCRRPATARRRATRSRTRRASATRRSSSRRCARADPPHWWDAVHAQWNGGAMDGFYRRAAHGDGNNAMPLLHGDGAAVLLQPVPTSSRRSARTTSARCSGRRGRTASTSCPARRAGSRRTASGATASSTRRRGRSSSTCSTTPSVTLEDLLHRLRRRRGRRHRQRRRVLEPLGARPAHDGDARRLPRATAAAGRCRTSRGSSRASRCSSTSIRRRGRRRSAWASSSRSSTRSALPPGSKSAFLLTYDEHGGFFDHVPPPQVDAYGLGDPGAALGRSRRSRGAASDRRREAGRPRLDAEVHRAASGACRRSPRATTRSTRRRRPAATTDRRRTGAAA